jgi:CDP-diacylglycerol---serine O-phosphatidyltransferase
MVARWRYALPNVITCVSITSALLAIAEAVSERFDSAAWFVLLCAILDKADGTLARLLHASSRFGVEMDSLSDLIAFGVAPAALILSVLSGHGALSPLAGWGSFRAYVYLGCFLFVIGTALRLAKFNVMTDTYGKDYFFGIPTPICGGFVAAAYLVVRKYGLPVRCIEVLPGAMILLALLMVSRIPVPKMGKRQTVAMNVFQLLNVVLVYACVLLRLYPEYLLAICVAYGVGGAAWGMAKGIRPPAAHAEEPSTSVLEPEAAGEPEPDAGADAEEETAGS